MPKFTVIITRDITESTILSVEAESAEAAHDAALKQLCESENTEWEIDDGSWNSGNPYVTDISED